MIWLEAHIPQLFLIAMDIYIDGGTFGNVNSAGHPELNDMFTSRVERFQAMLMGLSVYYQNLTTVPLMTVVGLDFGPPYAMAASNPVSQSCGTFPIL